MKSLPRIHYHFSKAAQEGELCPLPAEVVHYLATVLRCHKDDRIRLFNASEGEWEAEIIALEKKQGKARLLHRVHPPVSVVHYPLMAFAPLKREATDLIIRMGTELGVKRFSPVITAHSNTHTIKEERWHAIACEAAEQCERLDIPEIDPLIPVETFLQNWPTDKILAVAVERLEESTHLDAQSVFAQNIRQGQSRADGVLIGPEGGFSAAEKKYFSTLPFVLPVSLGHYILRAETAAIVAFGLLQAINNTLRYGHHLANGEGN